MFSRSLPLVASLAPSNDPNGNGVVLTSPVTVPGQTTAGTRVRLNRAEELTTYAVADEDGNFSFQLQIAPAINTLRISAVDADSRAATLNQTVRLGDVVMDWNASLLNVICDWTTIR